jgi:glycosyltransferase involved in cell wall biosynthesis
LRLLFLNHNVVGTGTYLRALRLGDALASRGHEVTVVTTSRNNRFGLVARQEGAVRVVEAPDLWWGPARTGWDPWNTLSRLLHLRGTPMDVIHAFDGRPVVSVPAWLLSRRYGTALVMDWADWWGRGGQIQQRSGWPVRTFFGPIETWFEEAFRPIAIGHTVISRPLRDRAVNLGLDPERVVVVPNGCSPDVIPMLDRAASRAELGLAADAPLAVHLGRLTPVDMGFLMDAVRVLRSRQPDARLVLVGVPGAPVPSDLLAAGAVSVTGFVESEDKDRWLAAADICVIGLPDTVGNRARWPSKINDYLSAGRATVITDVGDAATLVRAHDLGRVTAADPAAFGEGMHAVLAARAEMAAIGARARHIAEHELAWSSLATGVERVYEAALAAPLQPAGPASPHSATGGIAAADAARAGDTRRLTVE